MVSTAIAAIAPLPQTQDQDSTDDAEDQLLIALLRRRWAIRPLPWLSRGILAVEGPTSARRVAVEADSDPAVGMTCVRSVLDQDRTGNAAEPQSKKPGRLTTFRVTVRTLRYGTPTPRPDTARVST
ncbi:hypothetical protein GCM10020358_63060 [Amorphoplanes nipponensis]